MDFEQSECIQKILNGDQLAIEQLVTHHHACLYRLATAIVGNANADEVVQEAWISAIGAIADFKGRSSIKSWLSRIVINKAKTLLRAQNRSPEQSMVDQQAFQFKQDGHWQVPPCLWDLAGPEQLYENQQLFQRVKRTIEALPESQQLVIIMHDIDTQPMKEICNILQITASNARVLLHRARNTLYLAIDQYNKGK